MENLEYLAKKFEPDSERTVSLEMEEEARKIDDFRKIKEEMGASPGDTSFLGLDDESIGSERTIEASSSSSVDRLLSPEFLFISEMSEKGGAIDGYEIGEPLEEGGMGAVFRVRKDGKEYVMKTSLFVKQRISLEREIKIIDKINREIDSKINSGDLIGRPQVIHLVDFSTSERAVESKSGLTYAVLELLEGSFGSGSKTANGKNSTKGKTSIIEKNGKINFANGTQIYVPERGNETRVLMYLWHMLHSIEFMHDLDIVHRDIKYHNSMDKHSGHKLKAVLLDFGLALDLKDEDSVRSNTQMAMTPKYITKDFLNTYCNKYENKMYRDCRLRTLRTILRRRDYSALALSAYQMMTGVSPYSIPLPGQPNKFVCILDGRKSFADYVRLILDFPEKEISYDVVKRVIPEHGDFFSEIFDTLLCDKGIIFKENLKQDVYRKILGSEVAKVHKNLFPPYTSEEVPWLPK